MLLDRHGVAYEWHDTDASEEDQAKAREISGLAKIPVIVFPDGSFLSEPSNPQLEERLTANNLLSRGDDRPERRPSPVNR